MSSRQRVENRAELIYNYLVENFGSGFTLPELCVSLGIQPGSTTTAAIRRARELATEAGYHFPPAIAANEFRYKVTNLAADALDPALQMARIERGVRLRKEDGLDFIRRERKNMPSDMRPYADLFVESQEQIVKALSGIQKIYDDFVVSMMKSRKGQRDAE